MSTESLRGSSTYSCVPWSCASSVTRPACQFQQPCASTAEEVGDAAPQARGIERMRMFMVARTSVGPQLVAGYADRQQPMGHVTQGVIDHSGGGSFEIRLDHDHISE